MKRHKFPTRNGYRRVAETCSNGCGISREPKGQAAWVYRHPTDPRWPGGTAPPCVTPACPRCKNMETTPLCNFGRAIPGRFQCLSCKRWFGPNNPPDAGGTGLETAS